MRRIDPTETLHGTRDGQVAVDGGIAQRFGLTPRESACAALLRQGRSGPEMAERLGISPSTAEKHLVALRRKLGASTTLEAAVALFQLEDDSTARFPESYGLVSVAGMPAREDEAGLVTELRDAATLEAMLTRVRDELLDEGVVALFYFFAPLAAASYRKADILQRHSAPQPLVDALLRDEGATMAVAAARLFGEPDQSLDLDLSQEADGVTPAFRDACRHARIDRCFALGSPFGTGYVVLSAFCEGGGRSDGLERTLRRRLLLLQNVAYSFGALARTAGLSGRERDALSEAAAGKSTREIAEASDSSERAVGLLLQSARTRLGARTTTEAVAKAMALNALVFL